MKASATPATSLTFSNLRLDDRRNPGRPELKSLWLKRTRSVLDSDKWTFCRCGIELALVSGVAVIVSAVISINAGLVLVDSPITLASFKPNQNQPAQSEPATNTASAQAQTQTPAVTTGADGVQHINIKVGNTSYLPSKLQVKAGMPTDLTLNTKNLRGCTQGFLLRSVGIQQILPKTGATTLQLGTLKAGTYRYTCSMGMYSGSIQAV